MKKILLIIFLFPFSILSMENSEKEKHNRKLEHQKLLKEYWSNKRKELQVNAENRTNVNIALDDCWLRWSNELEQYEKTIQETSNVSTLSKIDKNLDKLHKQIKEYYQLIQEDRTPNLMQKITALRVIIYNQCRVDVRERKKKENQKQISEIFKRALEYKESIIAGSMSHPFLGEEPFHNWEFTPYDINFTDNNSLVISTIASPIYDKAFFTHFKGLSLIAFLDKQQNIIATTNLFIDRIPNTDVLPPVCIIQ